MTARTPAYDRFVASMQMDYMKWHDGIPYDVDALSAVSDDERAELEARLISQKNDDWRVSEALAKLSSPDSIRALEESAKGPNREVRLRAGELLHDLGKIENLDEVIVEGLRSGALGEGLAQAERLAAEHPSDAVKDALLYGALCSIDGRAVRFAALLFFLHGRASEPFDWDQRPFFLRFSSLDEGDRRAAFDELCRRVGVDGSHVRCVPPGPG